MKKILLITLLILGSVTTASAFSISDIFPWAKSGNQPAIYGAFSDGFKSIQLAPSPSNGNCLKTDGTDNLWGSCGSGGSGGGTWSTTTSLVSGQLLNYPNNTTDIVMIGHDSATSSAEFYFDPNQAVPLMVATGRIGAGGVPVTVYSDSKLHTYRDTTSITPSLVIEEDGTGDASIQLLRTALRAWTIGIDSSDSNKLKFSTNSTGVGTADYLTINDDDGFVGIGDTSPTQTLTVTGNQSTSGYLRVGSETAPNNTTAGDLTATRASIGNSALGASGQFLRVTGAMTDTTNGATQFASFENTFTPASNSSSDVRALNFTTRLNGASGITMDTIEGGHIEGGRFGANQDAPVTSMAGITTWGATSDSTSGANGLVGTIRGISLVGMNRTSGTGYINASTTIGLDVQAVAFSGGTSTDALGINVSDNTSGASTTNTYGIDVDAQTRGSVNNYGIRIDAPSGGSADNYALYLSGTGGTSASGITWGDDTNLYRSLANVLKTDDSLIVAGSATTTNLDVTSLLTFNGVTASTWAAFCTTITGGAGLCDGSDATGAGGNGLATSTAIADTYVIYGTSADDVGAEAAFTYDDSTNLLTVEKSLLTSATTTNFFVSGSQFGFGSAGVDFSQANGVLTILGKGTGADEGLNIDLDVATNIIALDSDTGATGLQWLGAGSGATTFRMGLTGVRFADDGDGALTIQGFSTGADEDLTLNFDDTANEIDITSSTGVTLIDWNTLDFNGGDATTTTSFATTASSTNLFASVFTFGSNILSLAANTITAGANAVIDFASAISLRIPTNSAPTFSAEGQIALDNTSDNLVFSTSTAATSGVVFGSATTSLYSFAMASTSADWVSGGVVELPAHHLAQVATAIICKVDGGTSVVINLSDIGGTSDTNAITCTTTSTQFALTSNQSFAAYAPPRLELGTITGSADRISIRVLGYRQAN